MNQDMLLAMLSRLVKQLLPHFEENEELKKDPEKFAERLASETWNGLILMLRLSFANSQDVLLDDVGQFTKSEGQWNFQPAASLVESDAIDLPADEGYTRLAQQAVFYLREGAMLLESIPFDLELPSPLASLEDQFVSIVLNANTNRTLSHKVSAITSRLTRKQRRLQESQTLDQAATTTQDERATSAPLANDAQPGLGPKTTPDEVNALYFDPSKTALTNLGALRLNAQDRELFQTTDLTSKYKLLSNMNIQILTPPEYSTKVLEDLEARHARVESIYNVGSQRVIHAFVPLSAMVNYRAELGSITEGRASFNIETPRYKAPGEAVDKAAEGKTRTGDRLMGDMTSGKSGRVVFRPYGGSKFGDLAKAAGSKEEAATDPVENNATDEAY